MTHCQNIIYIMRLILIIHESIVSRFGYRIDEENNVGELTALSSDPNGMPAYDRLGTTFPDEMKFSNIENYRFP